MSYDEKRKEYIAGNRDKFLHYAAKQRDKLKEEMVAAYGGECVDCHERDVIVLVLDHINDDARVEIEEFGLNARGGHKQYQRLKAQGWPKNRFQLLCANCNMRKEHKRRRDGMYARNGAEIIADRVKVQARIGVKNHNTSGLKGVFWVTQKQKWTARMMVNYKSVHLGFFDDIRDAARAYKKAALETWGADANVPTDEEIEIAAQAVENPVIVPASVTAGELGL